MEPVKDPNLDKTDADKETKPRPTMFIYGGVTLVVVASVMGWYAFISAPKVSDDYINKFNAVTALYQKISADSDSEASELSGIGSSIGADDSAGNYGDAAKVVNRDISDIDNLVKEVGDLNSSISEFSTVAQKVKDSTVRNDSLQVVSLWQQGNASFLKLLGYETQMLSPAEQYYKDMASGQRAVSLTNAQAETLVRGIQNETDGMSNLSTSIESAYTKLSTDLGMELQTSTTTGQ